MKSDPPREQGHPDEVLNALTDDLTNDEHPQYAAALAVDPGQLRDWICVVATAA